MSVPEAADRTVLAWRRSGLALVLCGVAMLRGVDLVRVERRPVAGGIVAGLGVAVSALFAWTARRRALAGGTELRPARLVELAPLAAGTALIGLACLGVALLA